MMRRLLALLAVAFLGVTAAEQTNDPATRTLHHKRLDARLDYLARHLKVRSHRVVAVEWRVARPRSRCRDAMPWPMLSPAFGRFGA